MLIKLFCVWAYLAVIKMCMRQRFPSLERLLRVRPALLNAGQSLFVPTFFSRKQIRQLPRWRPALIGRLHGNYGEFPCIKCHFYFHVNLCEGQGRGFEASLRIVMTSLHSKARALYRALHRELTLQVCNPRFKKIITEKVQMD